MSPERSAGGQPDQASAIGRPITHAILLVSLVPLMVGMVFLSSWQPLVWQSIAVASDGSRFAVLSSIGATGRSQLTIYDHQAKKIQSFELTQMHAASVDLSSDGSRAVVVGDGDPEGYELYIYDLGTELGERLEIDPSTRTTIMSLDQCTFVADDQSIFVVSYDGMIGLIPINDGKMRFQTFPDLVWGRFSPDRTKYAGYTRGSEAEIFIYDTSHGRFLLNMESPNDHSVSPDAVADDGRLVLHRVLDDKSMRTELVDGEESKIIPVDSLNYEFTRDGQRLICYTDTEFSEIDLETMTVTRRVAVESPNQVLHQLVGDDLVISPIYDDELDDHSRLHLANLSTSQTRVLSLQTVGPQSIRACVVSFLVASVAWIVAWVWIGLDSRSRLRGLLDAGILHALFGGAIALRIVRGQPIYAYEAEVSLALLWCGSLLVLAVLWMVMGAGRLSSKIAWVLFGMAAFGALLGSQAVLGLRIHAIFVLLVTIGVVGAAVLLIRIVGFRYLRAHQRNSVHAEQATRLTILDLLVVTAVIAVLIYVVKKSEIGIVDWDFDSVLQLTACGLAGGYLTLGCVWLALASRLRAIALLVVLTGLPAVGFTASMYARGIDWRLVTGYAAYWAAGEAILVASLVIFRLHGFQLVRAENAGQIAT